MEEHNTYRPDALKGRTAIVTGAGAQGDGIGTGRAIGITLARCGANVVLVDLDRQAAERTAEMAGDGFGRCIVVSADVSRAEDCAAVVKEAEAAFSGVDILINNVGIRGAAGEAPEVNPDEWDAGLRINTTAMMLMAKYTIPSMRRRGRGAIVNISSIAGIRGGHPHLLYPTSKGAVVGMTLAMATHHGGDSIRVNCICPGMVFTPIVASTGMSEERRKARAEASLLKVEGNGWDIADATLFLASDASRWITGQVISVDAGVTSTTNLVPSITRAK